MAKGAARGPAFTIDTPRPLDFEQRGGYWWTEVAGREVRLSNLDKIFWPAAGYTKGDLLAYYHNVADVIAPHLHNRPLTLVRLPDGIHGQRFLHKDAPSYTPDWMLRCFVPNFLGDGEANDFLLANDEAALLFVANLGCIEMHALHGRCPDPDVPDYVFFDLDPAEPAGINQALEVAELVRVALDALGLPSYPRLSGGSGVHVYLPIEPGPDFASTRAFAERVARAVHDVAPDRVTLRWSVDERAGKVFIDYNMNRRGQNVAAAYSARPTENATVCTPVTWDELTDGARPHDFTLKTIHDRIARVADPAEPVLHGPVDVTDAMEKLGVRIRLVDPDEHEAHVHRGPLATRG
jgi:bifunctional non-homologous end joining protein LigD